MSSPMTGIMASSPGGTTEVKVRKTREGKPKSRNGCLTCKIRRVKCDETRPICQRCTRFGQRCDGYLAKAPSKEGLRVTTTRVLAPKGASESPLSGTELLEPKLESPVVPFFPAPSRSPFLNRQESESFDRFCERTSHHLASSISKESWVRLVAQACESSPSIKYAVVAIGGLDFVDSQYDFQEDQVGTLKHQFAFRQYQQSTCLLRRDFGGDFFDLRTTFIGCLLFYCFENYRPYQEQAIKQVFSGMRMIRAWVAKFYAGDDNLERHVALTAENPVSIKEEIAHTFETLELKIMSYAHEREREAHVQYKQTGQARVDAMPKMFGSVGEARSYLELVVRRSMHWLRSTMHVQRFATSDTEQQLESQDRTPCLFLDTNPNFDDKLLTLLEYERWDEAFKPLLNFSRTRASSEENFLRASMLRLHWLSGYLSISTNNSRASLVNSGRFKIELQEMVHIAQTLLKNMNMRTDPDVGTPDLGTESVFDMQMIVPLVTVAWIYRHRTLRREAIELLLRSPKKDDRWDGIVVGKAMSWLADIEEEALEIEDQEEECIPERAAATCINMVFDSDRRIATVSCVRPARGTGGTVRREIDIPW